jgi:tetratricopeptide (TPR) repeat protein
MAGRQHPPQRARLYAAATFLSGILAALALDTGRLQLAHAYADEAFDLADAVNDADLQAWARATQSLIAYYADEFHDALAYARDGQRRAPLSPHLIRLAVNGEARALARLGERHGVDAAVDRAFSALTELPSGADVSESLTLGPYCQARTAANAATAYLTIGAADQAIRYANQALDAFDRSGLRGPQALSRLDLATAELRRPDPDVEHACALVAQAMTLTADYRFASVRQRAGQFLGTAIRWRQQRCVRDVTDLTDEWQRPVLPAGSVLPSPP